jgi:hypothetical protein
MAAGTSVALISAAGTSAAVDISAACISAEDFRRDTFWRHALQRRQTLPRRIGVSFVCIAELLNEMNSPQE